MSSNWCIHALSEERGQSMSTKRTAALAVGVAILIGGGATALAAANDSPARPAIEAVASAPEARSIDTAVGEAEAVIDTETAQSIESPDAPAPAPAPEETTASTRSASASTENETSDDGAAGSSARLAGPRDPFGAVSTMPSGWDGFDDSGVDNPDYTDHGPYDGPGLPFDINNINLDSLFSLARSVGIEVGVPSVGDDGSIKVAVTLPDGSEHTVWVAIDGDHHITDATVDGIPVMEFVRQFLAGEVGRPTSPVEPRPEWSLPD
jgi:hypothetical protein